MRKLLSIFFFLAIFYVIQAEPSFIPYHEQADYFLYSPGSMPRGLLGHLNPASLASVSGAELLLSGTVDVSEATDWTQISAYEYLGLFAAVPGLAFSLVKAPAVDGAEPVYYKLVSGFGNKTLSLGLGFGWSDSSPGLFAAENNFSFGLLARPFTFLSLGLFGTWTFSGQAGELVTDVAVRPFGNNVLTLFGDYTIGTPYYGLGLASEPVKGLIIGVRYEPEKPAFSFGLRLSFGQAAVASQFHTEFVDSDLRRPFLSLAARLGTREPSIIHDAATYQSQYLWLDLKGQIVNKADNFFFQPSITLLELLELLDKVKTDNSISALLINTSGMRADATILWELREKIREVKTAGKKVAIFIDIADINIYHFASVADQLIIDPMGSIVLPGYISGSTYYKGLLDKMGLGVDELRYYEYKAAVENLTRKDLSESDRQQRQQFIDDRYEFVRSEIGQTRGFSGDKFDDLVNNRYYTNAQQALELKLVDKIAGRNELDTLLDEWLKDRKKRVTPGYIESLPPADYDHWSEPPAIALVYAEGLCAMDMGIRARELAPLIEQLGASPAVRAIVLRVNSPGGDALASELVAQAVKKVDKPVIVSQGAVAASGGYWIAMNGDYIFSTPATLTGSIGVIFSYLYNKGFKEGLGLTTDAVQRGQHADILFGLSVPFIGLTIPNQPLSAEEKDLFASNLQALYQTFVTKAAAARQKSYEDMDGLARGRIWSGKSALEKGLIDNLGGLEQAIRYAKEKAQIPEQAPVKIIEYPDFGFFNFEQLMRLLPVNLPGMSYLKYKQQREAEILWENLRQRLDYNGRPVPLLPWSEWEMTALY